MLLLITSFGLTLCLYHTHIVGLSVIIRRLCHTWKHTLKTIEAAYLLVGDVWGDKYCWLEWT